jgi:hypothetical protein
MRALTEQQETLLVLKWGENYISTLFGKWLNNEDAEFTAVEREAVYELVRGRGEQQR